MSRKTSPFVVDVVEEFLRTKSAREPKTMAKYSGILRRSLTGTKRPLGKPFAIYFANRRINTLAASEVSDWFAQRVQGGAQDTKHGVSKCDGDHDFVMRRVVSDSVHGSAQARGLSGNNPHWI